MDGWCCRTGQCCRRCRRCWSQFLLRLSSRPTQTLYFRIWIKMLMQPGHKKPNKERQPHHTIIAIPMFIMFIPSGLTVITPSLGKKQLVESAESHLGLKEIWDSKRIIHYFFNLQCRHFLSFFHAQINPFSYGIFEVFMFKFL